MQFIANYFQCGNRATQSAALLLTCVAAVTLAGCQSHDVSVVKGEKFDADPSMSIGQALDSWKVCESTKWTSSKDDRGRDVVEYRCDFRGYKDFAKEAQARMVDVYKTDGEKQKTYYDESIKQAEADVAEAADRAQKLSTESKSPELPEWIVSQRARLDAYVGLIAGLRSPDKNVVRETALKMASLQMNEGLSYAQSCYSSAQARGMTDAPVCDDLLAKEAPHAADTMQAEKDSAEPTLARNIERFQADYAQQMQQTSSNVQQGSESAAKRLDELKTHRSDALSAIDEKTDKAVSDLKSNPSVGYTQVFRWSVADDDTVMLIGVGTVVEKDEGKPLESWASSPNFIYQLIAANRASNYSEFVH
jgi:hypothetical protein